MSPFLGCPPAFPADGRRGCGHPGPPVVDTWVALPEARGASALPHGSPNGPWRPEASDLVGTAKPGRGPLGLGSCSLGPRLSRGGQSLLEGTRFGRSKAGAQRPHDAIQEHLLKSTENEVITLDADWAPMVCMAHASCWQHQADTWPLPTALPFASSQGVKRPSWAPCHLGASPTLGMLPPSMRGPVGKPRGLGPPWAEAHGEHDSRNETSVVCLPEGALGPAPQAQAVRASAWGSCCWPGLRAGHPACSALGSAGFLTQPLGDTP